MLFSSVTFLYAFLPLAILVYFLAPAVPMAWRNAVLLVFSLVFYFFGEPVYVSFLLISSLSDYIWSLLIEKYRHKPRAARMFLVVSIVINLGMLGFFKYTDFFIETVKSFQRTHQYRFTTDGKKLFGKFAPHTESLPSGYNQSSPTHKLNVLRT